MKGQKMKKATKKRDRKYGKSTDDAIDEVVIKQIKKSKVKIMIDYSVIREFKSRSDAERFINNKHKEADKSYRPRSSFIYI